MIYSIVKRAFDVIIATLFLIVTFPILIILIFVIRLDGQGKAIFKQDRVGKNGKIFALDEHLDRLYRSAALIEIEIPYTREEMAEILYEAVSKSCRPLPRFSL